MGLDIYLYKYKDFDDTRRREKAAETETSALWKDDKKYEEYTDEEKHDIREKSQAIYIQYSLDSGGVDSEGTESIEHDSEQYPEHMFKVGYFRSSYNNGGMNSVLRNTIGKDLQYIFSYEDTDEDYYVKPNWEQAKKNVSQVIAEFKAYISKGAYNAFPIDHRHHGDESKLITDEQEAIVKFKEKAFEERPFESFENRDGVFYLDKAPLKLRGFIYGTRNTWSDQVIPCTYVIFEDDLDWYLHALEIIEETIDFVMVDKQNIHQYRLSWSG